MIVCVVGESGQLVYSILRFDDRCVLCKWVGTGLDDFFANLGGGGGYAWIIGASLGALVHLAISRK